MDSLEEEISKISNECRLRKDLKINHGWDHTRRVVFYSKLIFGIEYELKTLPGILDNRIKKSKKHNQKDDLLPYIEMLIAAYFHDVGRVNDKKDDNHAKRSAGIAYDAIIKNWSSLSLDVDSTIFAIMHHSNSRYMVVNDIVWENIDQRIPALLWDADRLDMLRFLYIDNGNKTEYLREKFPSVSINFLNTDFAKVFANTRTHHSLYR